MADPTKKRLPAPLDKEMMLKALVEEAQEYAMLLLDADGTIRYLNYGAELTLGYRRADLVGKNISQIFTPEDQEHRVSLIELENARRSGATADERWHQRRDGSRFWASGVARAIKDDSGEVIGFSKTFRNTTMSKQTEDELKVANAELSHFAASAAHDLQEPLRMINSYLQLLQQRNQNRLDESSQEFIRFALQGARRMHTLVLDLLDFTRLGRTEAELELVETNAVFDGAVANLKLALEEAKAQVTRTSLPPIFGRPVRIGRVFQNLIANAIKFRGPQPPRVLAEAVHRDREWLFSVKDNGIGIAAENLERIFGAFERLHRREEYAGSGLGLALCRKIIEERGGKIWAESTPGAGTTFYFTIPDNRPVSEDHTGPGVESNKQ